MSNHGRPPAPRTKLTLFLAIGTAALGASAALSAKSPPPTQPGLSNQAANPSAGVPPSGRALTGGSAANPSPAIASTVGVIVLAVDTTGNATRLRGDTSL